MWILKDLGSFKLQYIAVHYRVEDIIYIFGISAKNAIKWAKSVFINSGGPLS